MKHTPAPWVCTATSNHAHDYRLSTPTGPLPFVRGGTEQYANARLIAAAPELLEALQACIDYGVMTGDEWVTAKAHAAIAKATGGAA